MLALALASYLSLYPVLLLPPLILLCFDRQSNGKGISANAASFAVLHSAFFAGGISVLLYMSYLTTGGSWEFLSSTYGVHLLLPDLTPNVGLWWYFFIEMFDPFREFFLGVFWLHLGGYVGGLCFRVRKQPLFVVTTLLGLFAIFKPYPSISDTSLYFAFLPLYRHIFPLMRYTFFAVATLLYATLLGPAFYYLWIYAGSGNANFFYAITLVWSLGLSVIVADSLYAVLRDEWEVERPEMKGKDVKRI
ncbi:MAG: GPI transamidase component PIG-U [Lasallia pustulata]|nr:MAG: GPI transamidase component PIG-U [Lasallia pustulata]